MSNIKVHAENNVWYQQWQGVKRGAIIESHRGTSIQLEEALQRIAKLEAKLAAEENKNVGLMADCLGHIDIEKYKEVEAKLAEAQSKLKACRKQRDKAWHATRTATKLEDREYIEKLESDIAFLTAFADPPDQETGKTVRDEQQAEIERLKKEKPNE